MGGMVISAAQPLAANSVYTADHVTQESLLFGAACWHAHQNDLDHQLPHR
jgi:hypothetical protein